MQSKIKFFNEETKQFETIKKDIPLKRCSPDWIQQGIEILCPDITKDNPIIMQGILYSSDIYQYPGITLFTCYGLQDCKSSEQIAKIFAGGRFFFYMQKPNSVNYATGEQIKNNKSQFYIYQYFIIQGFYNRNEIVMQYQQNIKKPDFATQFKENITNDQQLVNQFSYMSNVVPNGKESVSYAFQVWIRLSDNILVNQITYKTSFDIISGIGALFSVLFTAFSIYFLNYNRNKFYMKNPDWDQFDRKIDKFDIDNSVQYNQPFIEKNNIQQE
ncbi:hypothetical protein IMG5_151530 [Ichthyophthirius multifiliis]|uniref:Transmembrane protein n=1 Tax=Ichthyophthirius multifiliis TaxID=5932 RepID=G0QYP7_ICHMU|nr:hypothetical protein IMG5_151530 [Ichthyophthirius multifiliis]EGR29651.1 hypothetical protein IMG5_151530 [Ichthyophthirius multifiliis]|eukprot:XP_004030887.1 hypothetical protein IMG5_151530 [Ichthyophthirius multifiliis]